MTDISSFTPEQRTRALLYYFGWQGGTIHQLAKETGVAASDLLYKNESYPDPVIPLAGFSAIRTCDKDWRVNRLAPNHKGEWPYWRDAIIGFWVTGPLDKKEEAPDKH